MKGIIETIKEKKSIIDSLPLSSINDLIGSVYVSLFGFMNSLYFLFCFCGDFVGEGYRKVGLLKFPNFSKLRSRKH